MKLLINTKALAANLSKLKPLANGTTFPALACVLLSADKQADALALSTTNLDARLNAVIPCTVLEAGSVVVNCGLLHAIAARIGMDELELSTDKKHTVSIKAGAAFSQLVGLAECEFPGATTIESNTALKFAADDLRERLTNALKCAYQDSVRTNIHGIHIHGVGGELRIEATDGRRLVRMSEDHQADINAVLPLDSSALLIGLPAEGEIVFAIGQNAARFEGGNWSLQTKLMEVNYPDTNLVIPEPHKLHTRITAPTAEIIRALDYLDVFVSKNEATVKLECAESGITASTCKADTGNSRVTIPNSGSNKPINLGVNLHFLRDALKIIEGETVTILTNDMDPLLIQEGGTTQIIMPMRIS